MDPRTFKYRHRFQPLEPGDHEGWETYLQMLEKAVKHSAKRGMIEPHAKNETYCAFGAQAFTTCTLYGEDGEVVGVGYSFWIKCKKFPYWNRKFGNVLALSRAMSDAVLRRPESELFGGV